MGHKGKGDEICPGKCRAIACAALVLIKPFWRSHALAGGVGLRCYRNREWYGWRHELYRAARVLVGENPRRIPVTDDVVRQEDTFGLTRWRLLETRLALELYRRQHDAWPEKLTDLVPEYLTDVPTDPFSGKPLVYRRNGKSFTLYSFGKDGVDSGGKSPEDGDPDRNLSNGDIDWECEHRGQANSWPRKK